MTKEAATKILWDYLVLHEEPRPMDAILAFGSNAIRVAHRATELFLNGYGAYVVFTGGNGKNSVFKKPEADVFAQVAIDRGVPRSKILTENKSENTGENILFSKQLLLKKGLSPQSLLLVTKPYMERRTRATFLAQWPGMSFVITSPQLSHEDYLKAHNEDWIHVMVGNIERIREYPALGFQTPEEIPEEVQNASRELITRGYTKCTNAVSRRNVRRPF